MSNKCINLQHVAALQQAVDGWYQRSAAKLEQENEEIMRKLRRMEELVLKGESETALKMLLSTPLFSHSLENWRGKAPFFIPSTSPISPNARESLREEHVDANQDLTWKVSPSEESESITRVRVDHTEQGAPFLIQDSCMLPTTDPVWGNEDMASDFTSGWRDRGARAVGFTAGLDREGLLEQHDIQQHPLWVSKDVWRGGTPPESNGLPTPHSSQTNCTSLHSRTLTPLPYQLSIGGVSTGIGPTHSSSVVAPSQDSSLFYSSTEEITPIPLYPPFSLQQPLDSLPQAPSFSNGYRVVVQFKVRHEHFISSLASLIPGEYVVVSGDRGKNIGKVRKVHAFRGEISTFMNGKDMKEIKQVVRRATAREVEELLGKQREAEREALACARVMAANPAFGVHQDIVLVDAEYQFDRRKLTFYYECLHRPDFRQFVRELYQRFHARIWMEKVKVTDMQ